MTSSLVIFRAFLFLFFRPHDPKSEKNSRKSTNKKILALLSIWFNNTPTAIYGQLIINEPWHEISNNFTFWQV